MKGYVITLVIVVLGVLIATRVEKAIAKKA